MSYAARPLAYAVTRECSATVDGTFATNLRGSGTDETLAGSENDDASYPLIADLPYAQGIWEVDYVGRLALAVSSDRLAKPAGSALSLTADVARILAEVTAWIASKRVDPRTHEILLRPQVPIRARIPNCSSFMM